MEQPYKEEIKLEEETLPISAPVVETLCACRYCDGTEYKPSSIDAVFCTYCGAFYVVGPMIKDPCAVVHYE